VNPQGESRPGWKVLRVLGNMFALKGFDYVVSTDVRDDVKDQLGLLSPIVTARYVPDELDLTQAPSLMVVSEVPMYQTDGVVRRSVALLKTDANQHVTSARINTQDADKYNLMNSDRIEVSSGDNSIELALVIDDAIADNCIYIAAGIEETLGLGAAFSHVTIQAVEREGSAV